MIVNIAEAKANLSKLINRALHGERVVIAKNNTPLVDIVPHRPEGKRQLGLLKGSFTVPDDFLEPDGTIEAMFYGEDD
jgi:prevent-host-death family protein